MPRQPKPKAFPPVDDTLMKANNKFTRVAHPVKGAEVAKMPRTHATNEASEDSKRKNPQRMDILRRHALSSRQDNSNT